MKKEYTSSKGVRGKFYRPNARLNSAYSPDLPGCVATGKTRDQVTRNMHEAIELHCAVCGKTSCLCPNRTLSPSTLPLRRLAR